MSTSNNIVEALFEIVADVCWRQWSTLGAPVVQSKSGGARAVIDGEALLLTTAFVAQHERRLVDVMVNCAGGGATLLSVKRLTSLAERYPRESRVGMGPFAQAAVAAGDRRWRGLVTPSGQLARTRFEEGTWPWAAGLRHPAGLMLRLRAGFGHGTKADALTYLIGRDGAPATTAEIAEVTQTSAAAVRVALSDMVTAGFVRDTGTRPGRYFVRPERWKALLGIDADAGKGIWRDWAGVFGYVSNLLARMQALPDATDYVLASAARDVYEQHRATLEIQNLPLSSPHLHAGPRYLEALERDIQPLRRWFARML